VAEHDPQHICSYCQPGHSQHAHIQEAQRTLPKPGAEFRERELHRQVTPREIDSKTRGPHLQMLYLHRDHHRPLSLRQTDPHHLGALPVLHGGGPAGLLAGLGGHRLRVLPPHAHRLLLPLLLHLLRALRDPEPGIQIQMENFLAERQTGQPD